jgi:prefoldin alpha subunit
MVNEEQKKQELIQKFQAYQQQAQQLQKQIKSVTQNIEELEHLSKGLEDLKGKKGKELLTQIGRGIFVKAKLLSEKLTVDIGQGNFVQKDIDETKKILEEQTEKLRGLEKQLNQALENLSTEVQDIFSKMQ